MLIECCFVFREPKDCDPQLDLINNGRVGYLIAGKEGIDLFIALLLHIVN